MSALLHRRINPRFLPFLIAFITFLSPFFFHLFTLEAKKLDFQELSHAIFLENAAADTLSLHYTLAFPSDYGLENYEVTLPLYDKQKELRTNARLENLCHTLNHLSPEAVAPKEQFTYRLMKKYMEQQKNGGSFALMEELFAPSSNLPSEYAILMAEYTLRTKQDVRDYLTLLGQTGAYFASLIEFQTLRAKEGYALSTRALEETIAQFDNLITKEELQKKEHFLQQTFRERLQVLVARDVITPGEASAFMEQNERILTETVLPAYAYLGDALLLLKDSCQPARGLYYWENGTEYYTWLLQKSVGTSASPAGMLELLQKDYNENLEQFHTLREDFALLCETTSYDTYDFPLEDRAQMLEALEDAMAEDFPSLKELSPYPLTTLVKSVSPCLEDYSAPAFYLTPPIDSAYENTIYINEKTMPAGLELFTTLAHEGYPGHLYQTVYFQLFGQKTGLPLIRHLMHYGGYVEGWAIYTEFLAYDYAASLFPAEAQEFYQTLYQLMATDRKLQLAVLSMLDIYLHYYGDSLERVGELLTEYGISEEETWQEVYHYILEEPGTYPTYYMGYLFWEALKEKAETLMGSAYSDYRFHTFVLQAGPSDFDSLEELLVQTYSSSSMDSR